MNEAVEFLLAEYRQWIGFVRRRIDRLADQEAEDIVQDVIVRLIERTDPTVPIRDFGAFIYTALRNGIIDRFRKRRETLPLKENLLETGVDPLLECEKRETLEALFAALEDLAPEERDVILATEFEGRPFKELAEEWRIPLGTLLARKSRAIGKIRVRMRERQQTDQGAHP